MYSWLFNAHDSATRIKDFCIEEDDKDVKENGEINKQDNTAKD